jgi:hypothetical protein
VRDGPEAPGDIGITGSPKRVSFSAEREPSIELAEKGQRAEAKASPPARRKASPDALARPPKLLAASAVGVAAPNPPQPSPTPPGPPEAGLRRFGNWLVLGLDGVRKRATCMCDCGTILELAVHALEEGATTSCGCSKSTVAPVDRSPSFAFSRDLAALDIRAASGRHRGRT